MIWPTFLQKFLFIIFLKLLSLRLIVWVKLISDPAPHSSHSSSFISHTDLLDVLKCPKPALIERFLYLLFPVPWMLFSDIFMTYYSCLRLSHLGGLIWQPYMKFPVPSHTPWSLYTALLFSTALITIQYICALFIYFCPFSHKNLSSLKVETLVCSLLYPYCLPWDKGPINNCRINEWNWWLPLFIYLFYFKVNKYFRSSLKLKKTINIFYYSISK